jgi:hypothetical protein
MTAHSALYHTVKVAGGGPSVHACAVFLGAKSRHGDKFNQTPRAYGAAPAGGGGGDADGVGDVRDTRIGSTRDAQTPSEQRMHVLYHLPSGRG